MDPEDRRAEIVAATRRMLGEFGVKRATVGDVAEAAGVSRQTVYEYFPSRTALVQGALKAGARELVERGREAGDAAGGPPTQRLAVLCRVALDFFRASPLWSTPAKRSQLVQHVALEGGVFMGAGTEAIEDCLAGWWPEASDARRRRAADTLARVLISHGLAPSDQPAEEAAAELADLVARGLS